MSKKQKTTVRLSDLLATRKYNMSQGEIFRTIKYLSMGHDPEKSARLAMGLD